MKINRDYLLKLIQFIALIMMALVVHFWIATQFTFTGLLMIAIAIFVILSLIIPSFKN